MESEKDQTNINTEKAKSQNPEGPEENPIIALIVKDLSDIYIRYDVNILLP
jgi:hypothetical protein